jgi:hypothetical protein
LRNSKDKENILGAKLSAKKISNNNLSTRTQSRKKPRRKEPRDPDEWTSKEKTTFRRKKEWIEFRKRFLKEHDTCVICGVKSATVHHKYKKDYNVLQDDRFLPMCRTCHRYAHRYGQLHDRTSYTHRIKEMLREIDFGDEWINS